MQCKICNKEFSNFEDLSNHLVKEHGYDLSKLYNYFEYSFETREAHCPICGKEFRMDSRQVKKYKEGKSRGIGCCAQCSRKLFYLVYGNPSTWDDVKEKKKQKSLEKYGVKNVFQSNVIKDKIKQTNLEKYGVEYVMQSPEVMEKARETNLKNYGVKHVSQREDIKDRKKKKSLDKYGVENVSQAGEVKEKKKQKSLEKYGVDYVLQALEVREKGKQTNLERYGFEFVTQAPEIQEKIKQTNLERYGFEYASQAEEVKEKIRKSNEGKHGYPFALLSSEVREKVKQTILERYGVETVFKSPEIREKIKQTNLDKYGFENVAQSQEIQEKMKQTNLKKYGVEYPLQSPEIREKAKQTNLEKYGFEYPSQSPEIQKKIKQTSLEKYGVEHPSQALEAKEKRKNTNLNKYGLPYTIMADEVKEKVKNTFEEKYNVSYFCQHEKCIKSGGRRISSINKNFQKLLKNNSIESELEFIIEDLGYDLKVNSTLIEINPYFTHNVTTAPSFNKKQVKSKIPITYHLDKTNFAKEHGYSCLHVFDWDDCNKIIYLLQNKEKIQARKCTVKEMKDKKEVHEFLGKYHLQGSTKGFKYGYGLYYDNELVQVMTFGKPRYNKNYEYELLRLCSHPKYKVVGGAGKLLKYFENEVKPNSIISYCDLSKFNGDVYKKLEFELKEQTQPAKHWYNPKTKRHITDNLLRLKGFDLLHGTNFGKGTSNEELMRAEGYVEIYDCGQLVFVK